MAATVKLLDTLNYARVFPSLTAALGNPTAGYGGNAVPLRIGNKVIQEILQKPFAYKWNRTRPPTFNTNSLQQDYSTSITNLSWLEDCVMTDINSTISPNPVRGVTAVRELLPCSIQGTPDEICWVYNSEAIGGTWVPSMTFVNNLGPGLLMTTQPLTQIWDPNGNLQLLTKYGTCGATAPTWKTTIGQVTNDGSAAWTMLDPNGITFRLSPVALQNGIVWQIQPFYQNKPPVYTLITNLWGIPDENSNLYEQGFLAYAWDCTEDLSRFEKEYALFQSLIQKAVGAGDREDESFSMSPSKSLTGIRGGSGRGDDQYPPGLWQ
jgi:hypothetical protein